jgi:[histone H3]-dimethyl/trimethyl-L-lysine36 demethylase
MDQTTVHLLIHACAHARELTLAAESSEAELLCSVIDACARVHGLAQSAHCFDLERLVGEASIARQLATAAREHFWGIIHSGDWRATLDKDRGLYAAAAAIEACLAASLGDIGGAFRAIDVAMMIATASQRPPLATLLFAIEKSSGASVVAAAANATLDASFVAMWGGNEPSSAPRPAEFPLLATDPARVGTIPVAAYPSVQSFYSAYFLPRRPVVVKGVTDAWPAHLRWKDPHYLLRVAGHRTVPVEFGLDYRSSAWSQELITVLDFMQRVSAAPTSARRRPCCEESGGAEVCTGSEGASRLPYLAQHALFDLLPALRADIVVPDYCSLVDSESEDSSGEVLVYAWVGPAQTVSCLHYDRPHNLLVQVCGWKYVRLYSPEQTPRLSPLPGALSNTSAVRLGCSRDTVMHPDIVAAPFVDTVIGPGDALYIPPGWWHYCEALTPSWSVSCWWGAHI